MLLHADSTFHIGQTHIHQVSPCQDYADHLVDGLNTRLVVSDGCSTGGKTDIGARLIARRFLFQAGNPFFDLDIPDLQPYGLTVEDMLATALVCRMGSGRIVVSVIGDGVLAWVYPKFTQFQKWDWDKNTPYYPVYGSRLGGRYGLRARFIEAHCANPLPVTETFHSRRYTGDSYERQNRIPGVLGTIQVERPIADLQAVALFTDGIAQITNGTDQMDWAEAASTCLDFKNRTGQFVKRRVRRAIQGWAKDGFYPQDDLSVAVLLVSHEDE